MSVKITGQRTLLTANNTTMLANATEASFHLKCRFENEGDPSLTTRTWVFGGDGSSSFGLSFSGVGTQPGTAKLRFSLQNNSGATVTKDVDMAAGAVYTLGLVFSATTGHRCYVNGQRYNLGTLAGTMPNHNVGFGTGYWQYTPTGSVYSVEDLALWEGYALTDQQINDLRDGVVDPSDIATGTWRGWWTMDGTAGQAVTPGAGGLLNSITGNTGGDFPLTVTTGTGTAFYGPTMEFEPSAEISEARISTSGRMLFVFMRAIGSQHETLCKSVNLVPALKINGDAIDPLTLTVANQKQNWTAFRLPEGERVVPGDVVTISATANWMDTVAGAAAGVTDGAVVNYAKKSCFRGPNYVKTLRMGVNTEYAPTGFNSLGQYMKNIKCRLGNYRFADQWGEGERPLRMTPPAITCTSQLYDLDGDNGLDATGYPGPTGLYAIGWDDKRPSVPTTAKIYARDTATTVVTPRPEYDNPGTIDESGARRGIVKVFEVTRKPGSTKYSTNLGVQWTNSQSRLQDVENEIISRAPDFTPGTPTVLDNSDPYALSETFTDLWKGAGSIRCWTSQIAGVVSPMWEREHYRKMTDFSWSYAKNRYSWRVNFIRADPFDPAETPYYYLPQFGEKYGATLTVAAALKAPYEEDILTITKDAGPGTDIIVGQRLFLGSEVCRVTEVLPSNQYRVIRGIENTTPAARAPGPIQVGYRAPMIAPGGTAGDNYWFNGHYVKLVSDGPHNLVTGWVLDLPSSFPTITFADGNSAKPSSGWGAMVVTGPDTMVVKLPPWHDAALPGSTLAAPLTLDPSLCYSSVQIPSQPVLPYAMMAKAANQMDCPTCFFALPNAGTDDFYYWIAEQIRDNLDVGRLAYIEVGNEQWNFKQTQSFYFTSATAMYHGQTMWATYVSRYKRVREIFNEVWGSRASDLRLFVNQQAVFVRSEVLNFAKDQSPPIRIDAVAIAPYHASGEAWIPVETQAAWANYEADEILDLYIHTIWHGIGYGARYQATAWTNHMATYTAATGFPCDLISYEGGIESMLATTVPSYVQKERDCWYHPNMYIIGQDFFANLQEAGYKVFNYFCSFDAWYAGRYMWGIYKCMYQPYGRGDGSDGKADNLLCLATPGKPNTKLSTVNQDATNVSTLGAAWLAWNSPSPPPPPDDTELIKLRLGGLAASAVVMAPKRSIGGLREDGSAASMVLIEPKRSIGGLRSGGRAGLLLNMLQRSIGGLREGGKAQQQQPPRRRKFKFVGGSLTSLDRSFRR